MADAVVDSRKEFSADAVRDFDAGAGGDFIADVEVEDADEVVENFGAGGRGGVGAVKGGSRNRHVAGVGGEG